MLQYLTIEHIDDQKCSTRVRYCVGAISGPYLFRHVQTIFCWLDVCFRCLFSKIAQTSRFTDCLWEKNCSESQKLGFFRFQDDLPTLLRNLRIMGHLHDGSICRQDFGSFAKISTTHETAMLSLHTENERINSCSNPMHFWCQSSF